MTACQQLSLWLIDASPIEGPEWILLRPCMAGAATSNAVMEAAAHKQAQNQNARHGVLVPKPIRDNKIASPTTIPKPQMAVLLCDPIAPAKERPSIITQNSKIRLRLEQVGAFRIRVICLQLRLNIHIIVSTQNAPYVLGFAQAPRHRLAPNVAFVPDHTISMHPIAIAITAISMVMNNMLFVKPFSTKAI